MVKAWYMNDETNDQRLEHHRNPPQFINLEELYKKTGVEYFNVSYCIYQFPPVSIEVDGGYTSI